MNILRLLNTMIATLMFFCTVTKTANGDVSRGQMFNNRTITSQIMIGQAITGGWSPVATDQPKVKKAAENAITLQAKNTGESLTLLSIEKAKQQVVKGMNYNLILKISRNGEETTAMVTVWSKLDGSYQVTEWWWKG